MRIGLFYPSNNLEHLNTLQAFLKGLQLHNEDVTALPIEQYTPTFDLAIIFGVYKRGVEAAKWRGRVIDGQVDTGRDYLVLEKGYIKRDKYYAVGLNGLNGRADFNNLESSNDRYNKLNVDLKSYREYSHQKHIILAGQVPTDASVQNVDIFDWLAKSVPKIKKRSNRKIIFRPHPLAINRTPYILGTEYSTRPLNEDLENAHCVVTYNSNIAVDAIISGIPAFAFDTGSMALPVADHNIDHIESIVSNNRTQWLNNLSYAQWNYEEMESGEAWEHIKPIVNYKLKKVMS